MSSRAAQGQLLIFLSCLCTGGAFALYSQLRRQGTVLQNKPAAQLDAQVCPLPALCMCRVQVAESPTPWPEARWQIAMLRPGLTSVDHLPPAWDWSCAVSRMHHARLMACWAAPNDSSSYEVLVYGIELGHISMQWRT